MCISPRRVSLCFRGTFPGHAFVRSLYHRRLRWSFVGFLTSVFSRPRREERISPFNAEVSRETTPRCTFRFANFCRKGDKSNEKKKEKKKRRRRNRLEKWRFCRATLLTTLRKQRSFVRSFVRSFRLIKCYCHLHFNEYAEGNVSKFAEQPSNLFVSFVVVCVWVWVPRFEV